MNVGVVGLQGAVSEHIDTIDQLMLEDKIDGRSVWVRRPEDLEICDALILPGGESTTISKLLNKFKLADKIRERAKEGMPIMGTCAGCILLAKDAGEQASRTDTILLGLMDMKVERNAFGRQKNSFQAPVRFEDLKDPFSAIFIRAPSILEVSGKCQALSRFDEKIIAAREENLLALAFHPELSGDNRIHRYLMDMV